MIRSSSFLQVTIIIITSRVSTNFGHIRSGTAELAAHVCLKIINTIVPSFLIGSPAFFAVTGKNIIYWMSLHLDHIS